MTDNPKCSCSQCKAWRRTCYFCGKKHKGDIGQMEFTYMVAPGRRPARQRLKTQGSVPDCRVCKKQQKQLDQLAENIYNA